MAQMNLQDAYGPMFNACTAVDCSTIVFGKGTCTEHDQKPPAGLPETLLSRAAEASHQSGSTQPPESPA